MISTHLFLPSNGDAQHCDGEHIMEANYEKMFVLTFRRAVHLFYSKCNLDLLHVLGALLR